MDASGNPPAVGVGVGDELLTVGVGLAVDGLGLAVTYGIVKMHRGDIRVESNSDPQAGPTGTKFTVTLPARRRENSDAPREEQIAAAPPAAIAAAGG